MDNISRYHCNKVNIHIKKRLVIRKKNKKNLITKYASVCVFLLETKLVASDIKQRASPAEAREGKLYLISFDL